MQDMVGSCKEIKNLLEKSFQKIKISHQSKKQLAKKKKMPDQVALSIN